jgi:hypothetical protein
VNEPAVVYTASPGGAVVATEALAEDAGPVPIAFVAVTVNVYDSPAVKPLTVIGDEDAVPVKPPGLDVAVKPVIAEPPLSDGASNVTEILVVLAAEPATFVGAPGTEAPAPPIIMFLTDIMLILRR